ncbi:MAG: UDP-N-acetylmuramoyl-L-alanyl-D-glutamate--2,6-diaminopimelate ligase [Eubacteriales bacterium]|nr:UDP-N-acetylmuramoyl-L-alanyl-D-glutamate--2,6-diaminopimelate ligase [Eubacteriales bacterium]
MNCKRLLEGLAYTCLQGDIKTEVSAIVNDSRKLKEGCMFICVKGAAFDGHDFAGEAAKKKAAVLLVERPVEVDADVTVIQVKNTRYAMALISAAWFGYPDKKLTTIAVTGTKGKTTTTYMIKELLEKAGYKTGVIGTIEVVIGKKHIPVNNTTPESYDIHKYFKEMKEAGCRAVVMEASSQGFKLDRTAGILFDYGIFTNLSPDHIGPNEHEDFEEYLQCKSMLFNQCKQAFANKDDAHFAEVTKNADCPVHTFGLDETADLRANGISLTRGTDFLGVDFTISGMAEGRISCGVPGAFNVHNALGAICVALKMGIHVEKITQVLKNFTVKGRVQIIPTGYEYTLIVDYAHNAVALESILKTLREYNPKRLISLFGCGGNRSRLRRFEMGEVSGKLADLTVITSDNPRFEEPQAIIDDIITGMKKTEGEYIAITDRREAISYVMHHGEAGDIIVLAGKGHETYQEIKGKKYHMSEEEIVQDVLHHKY